MKMYRIVKYDCGYTYNLDDEEDGIYLFDTEAEAYRCLEICFDNGKWINDERYGRIRYYVECFDCEFHWDGKEYNNMPD